MGGKVITETEMQLLQPFEDWTDSKEKDQKESLQRGAKVLCQFKSKLMAAAVHK